MADEFALTLNQARENTVSALTKAAQVMKTYYDRNKDESLDLQEGDKVYLEGTNITPLRPMKKLSEKRYGPFIILEKIGKSAYKLKLPKSWNQVHPVFNEVLLTPALPPLPHQSTLQPPPIILQGEEEYEVEAIVQKKKKGRRMVTSSNGKDTARKRTHGNH